MRGKFATAYNVPLLIFLLKYTCKVKSLENDETPISWKVVFEITNKHSFSKPEHWQPRKQVVFPLPVDILSVGDVDESGAIEFVALPVGKIEGEIVIDEDTYSVSLGEGVHGPLVFSISIVKRLVLHFNIKINNAVLDLFVSFKK